MTREEIVRLDKRHVWRPYTSSEDHARIDPLVIVSAQEVWLRDANGKEYIDGNGSWWVNTLGHNHPRLLRALQEQAQTLMHCSLAGITHETAAVLASELVEAAPKGLSRVFYSDDGSTAVEAALKIAFQYWQQNNQPKRVRFVSLAGAFHGETLGAASVGGIDFFRSSMGPLLFDVLRPPAPEQNNWAKVFEVLFEILKKEADQIAGVVVEPLLQGASGMRMWPAAYLTELRKVTQEIDTWLIADEVFTGYGRTGKMWAADHAAITPDILCIGKAFSGGVLPMAATLSTQRVYDGFIGGKKRAFNHGHSFCGNPLGAALAREVLAIYRDERVVEQVAEKALLVHQMFDKLGSLRGVEHTRTLGMVGAADLGSAGYQGELGWRVYEKALQRGAYLRPLGDTVYIAPPLTISSVALQELLAILYESVEAVLKK